MGHLSSCQKLNSSVSHDISAVQLAQPDTKWSPLLPDPVYKNNNLTDGMKCYTDYMPRPNNKMSLKARVISNNVLPPERPGIIPYVQG